MLDFDSADKRVASVIPLEFWIDHESVNGENVIVEWVKWQKIGNPNHCGEGRVRRVQRHQPDIWEALKAYYDAWKKNEEVPVDGTPIISWPPVTKKMAEILKTNGFRSVEDFSKATDADLDRIGMGARGLKNLAIDFVANKSGTKTAGEMVSLKEEIERLKEQIKFLSEANENLKSEAKKVKDVAPKRGRPRKEEVEDEPTNAGF